MGVRALLLFFDFLLNVFRDSKTSYHPVFGLDGKKIGKSVNTRKYRIKLEKNQGKLSKWVGMCKMLNGFNIYCPRVSVPKD